MDLDEEDNAPKLPVNYYKPVSDSLSQLVSPTIPGECVQKNLYFNSESWINLLHKDVEKLLFNFSSDYIGQFSLSNDDTLEESDVGKKELESPFEVFRTKWTELGWSHIHLLGILDGSMRIDWCSSVMRAFLEHIKKDEKPLYQIGAIFAMYTLYFTQAATLEKSHIAVNCDTLDYILTIPTILSVSLLPPFNDSAQPVASTSQTLIPSTVTSFSDDLQQIIYSLLAREAFFLIPTESYLFPCLPSVSIRDGNESNLKETAKLVIGAEEEMFKLASGDITSLIGIKSVLGLDSEGRQMAIGGAGEENENDYSSIEMEWKEGSGWKGNLKEMQERYLKEKEKGFPITSTSTSNKRQRTGITTSALRSITLSQAQNLTLAALKDAAAAAAEAEEGTLPGLSVLDSNLDSNDLEVFNLVGKNSDRAKEDEKGLEVYDNALMEFQKGIIASKNIGEMVID